MSFQLVGFLLTYLLHITHSAKNGSRAGLGITLVQFGFMMRGTSEDDVTGGSPPPEMGTVGSKFLQLRGFCGSYLLLQKQPQPQMLASAGMNG
jgi:hypothetical protein